MECHLHALPPPNGTWNPQALDHLADLAAPSDLRILEMIQENWGETPTVRLYLTDDDGEMIDIGDRLRAEEAIFFE